MSTKDYEVLAVPASTLADLIRQHPDLLRVLDGDVRFAMLGWAQSCQDKDLYMACSEALDSDPFLADYTV